MTSYIIIIIVLAAASLGAMLGFTFAAILHSGEEHDARRT